MLLTVVFAWRYRASNTKATYTPDWNHSTQLELVIWSAPLLIIICLGAITWMGTHLLDPYRSLDGQVFSLLTYREAHDATGKFLREAEKQGRASELAPQIPKDQSWIGLTPDSARPLKTRDSRILRWHLNARIPVRGNRG